jgi:hypothetical protein
MMDEALVDFIQHVISYAQAKDKKSIAQWESYCDRLLQLVEKQNPDCHQGFDIAYFVLSSLKTGCYAGIIPQHLSSDVYLIIAQVLKTICQKRPLSSRYELQLISLLNHLSQTLLVSANSPLAPHHHPIVTQLTLALASLEIHLIYRNITSSLRSSYSALLLTELQLFLQEKLSLIHSESVRYLFLQYLSEFFGSSDMKFWIGYKGKEKPEIIKNLQFSLVESSSIFFGSLLHNISSNSISANHDNEMLKIFIIGNEWIKHMNEMEIFSSYSDKNSSNETSTLSFDSILSGLRFWMKNSFLDFSFYLLEQYFPSALSSSISEKQNQLVDMSSEFLINIFEFYSHLLKNVSLLRHSFSSSQTSERAEMIFQIGEYFIEVSYRYL